jgi:alkaline phosphatase
MGLITDEHFGQATWGQKSPGYVSDAMAKMAPWQPDVVASLGDTCDGEWDETKLRGYYEDFSARARVSGADRAFVEGNHDVSGVYLDVMLAAWPADVVARFEPGTMFGSFDRSGVHVIMLDAEYVDGVEPGDHKAFAGTSGPGYVPQLEIDWLAADLAATALPAVVLSHEPIGSGNSVTNAAAVRAAVEASQKVVACFAGHTHKNAYVKVNGIHYFTLATIASDSGYTAHDLGTHAQATLDPAARRLAVETYENDSSKGYLLAHTDPVTYTVP